MDCNDWKSVNRKYYLLRPHREHEYLIEPQVASPPDIDTAIDDAQNATAGSPMEPKTTPAVELHKSIPKPLDPTEEGPSRDSVDARHPKKRKLENAAPKPVELGFEINHHDGRDCPHVLFFAAVRAARALPLSQCRCLFINKTKKAPRLTLHANNLLKSTIFTTVCNFDQKEYKYAWFYWQGANDVNADAKPGVRSSRLHETLQAQK